MIYLQDWYQIDPLKKDAEWGNKIITFLRQYMQPLVTLEDASLGMQYLLSRYDMEFARKIFKDPVKSGVDFKTIAVLEKLRNIIISEVTEAGVHVNANAIDPLAQDLKKRDKELLENRKKIEALMTTLRGQIGMPAYSLNDEHQSTENGLFSGNVGDFDNMGLDDNSVEDIDYFFRTHYRLTNEMRIEDALSYFIKFNELPEQLALWVDDVMAKKAVGGQTYVDKNSGAIKMVRVAPENIRVLPGHRRDFKDAPSISIERKVTVAEFLELVGDAFDWETEWQQLLQAINYTANQDFNGIIVGPHRCYGDANGKVLDYSACLGYTIAIGYIEFKSINGTTYKVTEKNFNGNKRAFPKSPNWNPEGGEAYTKQTKTQECTYCSYYLCTGYATQRLYKWGKLYRQELLGAEDTYSNFTIRCFKEVGPSMVEVAMPYIRIIVKAWVKIEWLINKAKAAGYDYSYESMRDIAKKMYPDSGEGNSITKLMELFEDSANSLHTNASVDGKPLGGGGEVNFFRKNGIDPGIGDLQKIIDWQFNLILDQLGISPLRNAYQPEQRDTFKLQEAAQKSSDKATGYLPRMIYNLIDNMSISALHYVQDIVTYKDIDTMPYNFLIKALGDETVVGLKELGKVSAHRYGIYLRSFDDYIQKQEIDAIAAVQLTNKEISLEQYLLIKSIESPKKALKVLSFERKRQEKREQELAQQQSQMRIQETQAAAQSNMQLEQLKGQNAANEKNIQGMWAYKTEELKQGMQTDRDRAKADNMLNQIDTRKDAKIEEKQAGANIEQQAPIV